ncbi:MAG: OmpA family protein [Ferruginibacter sp.]
MQNKSSYILRFICSFFIFITAFLVAPAQWYNPDKVNKKAGEVYALAYEEAIAANYKAALKHLEEAIKLDPKFVDVYLSRAGIYAELKNYEASVADFEKGIQMDSVYSKTYLLPYSISLAGVGKFKEALNAVNEFLANPTLNPQSIKAGNYRKSTYSFAVDYEKKHPVKNYVFKPVNLGDSINTSDLEYFPSLTIDGSKMIFTRRVASDEDFYESDFIDGRWSKAKPLGGKVNTNFNEGAQNISQDGQLLVFTGCNYPEGEGSCDLYFSIKTNTGWSEPQNLGPVVNTDFWESSPSLSPDKRDLYFASSRAGGLAVVIFGTHRMPNGKWSRPQNLGESVNTSGDESCPFIHADNETLYFNSNGHTGYGMTDLFFSKKINDSIWAPAENLGYPINNIDDQGSLIVAADGKTAYYASDGADTRGGLDIYSFQLRDDIRPLKTLWVKGKVYDKKTNAGLPSSVELTNVKTDRIVSKIQTDEDGNYLITLPVGNDYAFNVNRRGYLFYSDNFSITPNTDSVFIVNIALQPIEKGASIVLKNIFFETGKFDLQNESKSELDKLVELLNDNPNLKIQIDGHTDNVGQQKDNLELSNNRAKSVVGYLLSKGINQQRLSFKGFGATKPVADNNTETGRAKNRRTELYVTGN